MQMSKSFDLLSKALDYRVTRAKLISANIANIDTPYYKAKDIYFEKVLSKEAKKIFNNEEDLKLARTNKRHMEFTDEDENRANYFLRATHTQRNDANTVDLDIETTELSKNQSMFNAITATLQKQATIFKSILDASSKV